MAVPILNTVVEPSGGHGTVPRSGMGEPVLAGTKSKAGRALCRGPFIIHPPPADIW
jgi:hypothetical protein